MTVPQDKNAKMTGQWTINNGQFTIIVMYGWKWADNKSVPLHEWINLWPITYSPVVGVLAKPQ